MSGFNFESSRRLVIKVGSSLLIGDDGHVHRDWLRGLADDVARLHAAGHELLIVSSGSIAIGCTILGTNKRRAKLSDLQAAAAAGQVQLVHAYQEALAAHQIVAAQILLFDSFSSFKYFILIILCNSALTVGLDPICSLILALSRRL